MNPQIHFRGAVLPAVSLRFSTPAPGRIGGASFDEPSFGIVGLAHPRRFILVAPMSAGSALIAGSVVLVEQSGTIHRLKIDTRTPQGANLQVTGRVERD